VLFQYLKSAGTPVVWTLHDCHAFTGHCAFFDMAGCEKWKHGCGNCPQKQAYPKSILLDRSARNYVEKRELFTGLKNLTIVTPSNWLKALAEQSFLGEYPIQTIHNGIDPDIFKPTGSDLRSRFGVGETKLVLGVANIWEPRKGLLDFLALAEKLGDAAKVVLIGLSDRQIKDLPRCVTGIRRTANARELAAWYTAADVFVNPTLEDNFPTTQIEALACGTPVVTYDTGGCAEALDETCGVVVSKGYIDGLEKGVFHACDLQAQDCLKRASAFDQNDRFAEYAALYETLSGKAKL
jgi:glycosyltransferase involved in cell wall biosynthesis